MAILQVQELSVEEASFGVSAWLADEFQHIPFEGRTVLMSAWLDTHYRGLMLVGMALELFLLATLAAIEVWK